MLISNASVPMRLCSSSIGRLTTTEELRYCSELSAFRSACQPAGAVPTVITGCPAGLYSPMKISPLVVDADQLAQKIADCCQ